MKSRTAEIRRLREDARAWSRAAAELQSRAAGARRQANKLERQERKTAEREAMAAALDGFVTLASTDVDWNA